MWICSHAYVTNNDQTIELSNIKHGETWVGRRGWGKGALRGGECARAWPAAAAGSALPCAQPCSAATSFFFCQCILDHKCQLNAL